jgi:hypothetical protein
MAHFAKIEDGIVVQVNVVDEEYFAANRETRYTGQWVQTSYNTQGGVHLLGGTPMRKNYAGVGFTYDEDRDAFIPPKPFDSWLLDEDTCLWNAPISMPTDGGRYEWNEEVGDWVAIDEEV